MKRLYTCSPLNRFGFIFSIGLFLLTGISVHAQTPTWLVEGGAGSANAENSKAVCVDPSGNVYITGSFSNTVDFDFGGGTANLVSNGSNDIFIASYTSTGAYRWAVRAGGTANDNGNPAGGICTDGTNIYVTGSYNGAGTLFGATSLTPNGGTGQDAFVAKLNATTGAWIWAVSLGGTGNVDFGDAICLDPLGNPYVMGSFNGTLSGACANVSLGGSDIFISKLNPATGACVWASNGGSTGNDASVGGGICYDPTTTEIVVATNFSTAAATFGAFNIPNTGGIELCVLELNSTTGAWLGAVGTGSGTNDDAVACALDPSTGDVMVVGAFTGNITLPGGIPLTNSSAGFQDAWVGRYSIAANGFTWAKAASGTGNDRANGVAVDGTGSVLVAGQYVTNPTVFGAYSLTNTNSGGFDDVFVVCYSAGTGTEMWATKNTNSGVQPSANNARGIAYANSNNFWITGQYAQGCTFGALGAMNSNGFNDFYIAKLNAPPPLTATQSQVNLTCNGVCTGSATVVASGGTTPYTYSWSPSGGSAATASSLCAGTYTCTITDASLTSITKTFNITQPPALVLNANSQTNIACFGGATGAASVLPASGGAGGYTYNWTPGNPTGDGTVSVTGLTAGTWTCTVTDANSCTAIRTFNITQPTALVLNANSQTNISCFGGSNGAASVLPASGGAGGYTYNWTPGNPTGDGTVSVTGLTAGTWTCTVTDANSCVATRTFNITQPAALVLTAASQTNIACNGGATGAASVNAATGGAGGYTYNWTPGNPTGDGTVSVTGLTAGTWTCTVTDANSCVATQTFNITQPTAISLTAASQTNIACNGGATGAASVNAATGGAGGYTYNWTPGNPTGDGTVSVTGLTAGTWTCTVTDANSCVATQTFNITQPTALVLTAASQTNIACNGGATGAASVNAATGGAGGYTYNWTPGNPTGDGTVSVTGLTAGTWTCTVTDANSCVATQTFNITQPTAISLTAASQTNIACNGGATGAASVNAATGGAGGYTYNWTPGNPTGDGTVSVTGLTAGTWTCTVTDANSCTANQTFNITQPSAISGSISSTSTACTSNTGTATVSGVSGGTPGYTYNWTPGNPTGDGTVSVTGLSAGTWTCTITDANSCILSLTVTVTTVAGPSLTAASQTNISCFGGATGAASVNAATGGTSPYTYNWTPGNPTGDGTVSVTGLTAGTWTCTVTDANSCTATVTFNITQPTALVVSAASQTNISCNGGANGAASVTVSGGTTAYSYNWTPGNPTGDGTASVTGLTAGTWTCTVTDANSCVATQTFNITQPTALVVSPASQTNISCNGGANGAASVTVSGGTTAYSYNWTPGNPTGDGTASVTGLTAGTWTCTVTDANSCVATQTFNITQPTALVVSPASQTNISCNGGATGAASVTVSGGTTAYSYNWTPGNPTGDGTASVTGLTAGTWTCTVTDANSCVATQTFNITQPTALVVSPASQTNISCNGGANGAASVTVSGGTTAYSYNWTPGNPTGDGTASVTGLTAGTWTCTVTDANSCVATQTFNITQPSALVVSPASQTNISCNGGATGAASVTVSGGTTAYSYNWTPGNPTGDGTASVTGLTAGTWTCTVTDANSCVATQTFNITQPSALVVSPASQTNISCNGGATGAASVTVSGGTTAYSYNWTPGNPTGDGTASVTGLTAGTWTCTVTDANSCVATQTFNITQPSALVVSPASQTNVSCNGGSNGAASVTVSGGTTAYSYNWTPGNPTGDGTASVTGLTAGTWTCTVTDANSCVATRTFNITQPPLLTAAISSQVNVTCNGACNGSVTLIVMGGTPGYTYLWSPGGQTTPSINGLCAGTYMCTITDANGCVTMVVVTITEPAVLLASAASQTNISCNGGADGTASVSVTGGVTAYSYNWTPGNPTGDGTASVTGLTVGTWTCTVTDANSCVATQTFNITQPALLVASASATPSTICAGSGTSASASSTGGTGTVTFNWMPGNLSGANQTLSPTSTTTYTITATDANGCTSAATLTVNVNSLPVVTLSGNANFCTGGSTTLTGSSGGTSQWYLNGVIIPGATTNTYVATAPGVYNMTKTNVNGCSDSASVGITVTEIPLPVVSSVTSTSPSCNGGTNGTATVNATGSGSLSYSWMPSGGTAAIATGLTMGTYTCTITDSFGCSSTATVSVTEPAVLTATATSTDALCNGSNNGTAVVTASGGTPTYSYLWMPSGGTSDTAAGLAPGTYTCTITDISGCTTTQTVIISEPTALAATSSQTNVSCFGGTDGSATANASGGTAPYTYAWAPTGGTAPTTSGLSAGCYTCTITDANGCTTTVVVCITEPTALSAVVDSTLNPSSCGATDGMIAISTSGGTSGYTYLWSDNSTNEDLSGVGAGGYTCTITDINGCTTTLSATLNDPNAPAVTLSFAVDTLCLADAAAILTGESPAGGTWSGTAVTGNMFDPATAGVGAHVITYTYTDTAGCTGTATDTIWVDVCTGLASNQFSGQVKIYPNPNNGEFSLSIDFNGTFEMLNSLGQVIVRKQVIAGVNNINSSDLADGIYLVRLTNENKQVKQEKIIIRK